MGISLRGGGESSMCPSALRYRSAREEVEMSALSDEFGH